MPFAGPTDSTLLTIDTTYNPTVQMPDGTTVPYTYVYPMPSLPVPPECPDIPAMQCPACPLPVACAPCPALIGPPDQACPVIECAPCEDHPQEPCPACVPPDQAGLPPNLIWVGGAFLLGMFLAKG